MKKLFVVLFSIMFLVSCATPSMVADDIKCPVPPQLPIAKPAPIVVAPPVVIPPPAPVVAPLPKLEIIPFFFGFDKYNVVDQKKAIERAVTILNADKTKKAELQGNTDAKGSDKYNEKLGQRRADAVKDILIKNGVDSKRLTTKSFGKRMHTGQDAKDRRVDIVIKG